MQQESKSSSSGERERGSGEESEKGGRDGGRGAAHADDATGCCTATEFTPLSMESVATLLLPPAVAEADFVLM